jgi:phosphoenolpyruvate carboxykinase (ATP)
MLIDRKNGVLDFVTIGRKNIRVVHRNLPTPLLYEHVIRNREGQISHMGPIVVRTGHCVERPLTDKFIVDEPASAETMIRSDSTQALSEDRFTRLLHRLLAYMQNKQVYVQYCYSGQDPDYRTSIRFITETAWHSLFARNMFVPIQDVEDFEAFDPDFTVVHIPGFQSIPEADGTRSPAFVIFSFGQKAAFICGTSHAGEIRQAMFTIFTYRFPHRSVFVMRSSANIGADGDVAIFMGRGGTGKTALSVDPDRKLVGDHQHGWSDRGIFNLERGAYAKVLNISSEDQPEIHRCTRTHGTILENVSIDIETGRIDLNDDALTENTRAAYPLSHLQNVVSEGVVGHPRNIFLLTCDAMGVLPPIARLSPEMAVYAFLSGYTSRFLEPESGPGEPDIEFETCFGGSSLTLPAHVCGNLLMERIRKHDVKCWLLNTGWIGEPRGAGDRIEIAQTRRLIGAAVSGALDDVDYEIDPVFSFEIPGECPGIPAGSLNPRNVTRDEGEYELRAVQLAKKFMEDFAKYEEEMPENMRTMLSDVLSLDDSYDLLDKLRLTI